MAWAANRTSWYSTNATGEPPFPCMRRRQKPGKLCTHRQKKTNNVHVNRKLKEGVIDTGRVVTRISQTQEKLPKLLVVRCMDGYGIQTNEDSEGEAVGMIIFLTSPLPATEVCTSHYRFPSVFQQLSYRFSNTEEVHPCPRSCAYKEQGTDLWVAVQTSRVNISPQVFHPLVESMPQGVAALRRARGDPTRNYTCIPYAYKDMTHPEFDIVADLFLDIGLATGLGLTSKLVEGNRLEYVFRQKVLIFGLRDLCQADLAGMILYATLQVARHVAQIGVHLQSASTPHYTYAACRYSGYYLLETVFKIEKKLDTCKAKAKVGDYVWILRVKGKFSKSYTPNWSTEVYRILQDCQDLPSRTKELLSLRLEWNQVLRVVS
ncbi:hypothetical protein PR048_003896 [Dryococelus australis]|uniref:Uncharacterized protein n=1 Tax=Dryococelus australis TaxID=614101 RepID=A0ABQ9IQ39_9NEOP|nr:hypothetical protein PR048_003896 [Dryococelus australis]